MILAPEAEFQADLFSTTVDGHNVVYSAAGTTANPPLVFVHGWASSRKFWRSMLPVFGARRRCVAPDLLGFGLSDKPAIPYTMEAHAEYLAKFLDALGIGRTDLVAHSMGGTISLTFALKYPERVSRLVLVNPLIQGRTAWNFRTRLLTFPVLRWLAYWLSKIPAVRHWVAKDFTYVSRLDDDIVDDVVAGTYASTIGPILSMRDTDLAPRLGELTMPVCLIGCDRDLIISPAQHDLLRPHATCLRIDETGHIPMLERPDEFNRVLESFLQTASESPVAAAH